MTHRPRTLCRYSFRSFQDRESFEYPTSTCSLFLSYSLPVYPVTVSDSSVLPTSRLIGPPFPNLTPRKPTPVASSGETLYCKLDCRVTTLFLVGTGSPSVPFTLVVGFTFIVTHDSGIPPCLETTNPRLPCLYPNLKFMFPCHHSFVAIILVILDGKQFTNETRSVRCL